MSPVSYSNDLDGKYNNGGNSGMNVLRVDNYFMIVFKDNTTGGIVCRYWKSGKKKKTVIVDLIGLRIEPTTIILLNAHSI